VRAGTRDPAPYCTLAWARAQAGDLAGATALLAEALRHAPNDPAALTAMAIMLRHQGRLRDALLHCDAALAADPRWIDAWLARAYVFSTGGSFASALDCYRAVLAIDPAQAEAHAGLAELLGHTGDRAGARHHAAAALAADPANPSAAAALARAELEEGAAERAEATLTPLLAGTTLGDENRAVLGNLLGDALDRQGRTAKAYAAFADAKAAFARSHGVAAGQHPHRRLLEQAATALSQTDAGDWAVAGPPPPVPGAPARHVFVLGYPRSGNSLMEAVLGALPGVSALEERPTLAMVDNGWLTSAAGLKRLGALSVAERNQLRAGYWQRVGAAGVDLTGRAFIDMDPLKGLNLPVIASLFPEAQVLWLRRDPRDVVWSCFHTHFVPNAATLEFVSLEGVARHYDAMMRLITLAVERLPLKLMVVDYHALVRDFDATTQAVCAAVGLEWSAQLRQFDRGAGARAVGTASAAQVRRGLYDGTAQWCRYADYLAPVMPILQPWIERFGYAG
jgi:tetratricopeptide (TPR) repeat protein